MRELVGIAPSNDQSMVAGTQICGNAIWNPRLYAHKKVFEQVVEGVSAEAKKMKVGPGLDPSTNMGPLVSEECPSSEFLRHVAA